MRFKANRVWLRLGDIRGGILVIIALAGCFRDPDADKLVCQGNDQCPTGHWCTAEHKCSEGQAPTDGSAGFSVDLRASDTGGPVMDGDPTDTLSSPRDTPALLTDASDVATAPLDIVDLPEAATATLDAPMADSTKIDSESTDSTDAPLSGSGGAGGSGGTVSTGGVASTGGVLGSGGTISSLGGVGSGGVIGTGGILGSGGAIDTGGNLGMGGTLAMPPVISSFAATPATITQGKSTTLNWSVAGATRLSIAGVGTVSGNQWTVSPAQDTTYVLTAQNANDSASAQAVVTVVPAPSISSFSADSASVLPGGSTKLNPVFGGGTGRVDQTIGAPVTSGNSYATGVLSAKTTFTLTVTNAAGDAVTATTTVAVVGFVSAGTMSTSRIQHTATLLDNGKTLLAGGYTGSWTYQSSTELYDESAGTFVPVTSAMSSPRGIHTATRLGNGKVLLAGGNDTNTTRVSSADLYDPSTGTTGSFTAVSVPMTTARSAHTATLLQNGQVLLAGGTDGTASSLWSAELYDPSAGSNGTFRATATNMLAARRDHIAVILASGQVLIAGGDGAGGALSAAELYFNGSFTATGPMKSAREGHSAALLANGKVLIVGGYNGSSIVASAEVYDPQTGSFTLLDTTMSLPRVTAALTRLTDNTVLVTGGENNPTANALAVDLYDSGSGTNGMLRATTPMLTPRMGHTATLLKSGKVLVAGGAGSVAAVELYIYY